MRRTVMGPLAAEQLPLLENGYTDLEDPPEHPLQHPPQHPTQHPLEHPLEDLLEDPLEATVEFGLYVKELTKLVALAGPIAVGHITNLLLSLISLAFVGHLGTSELAAAALGTTLYNMTAKIVLAAMLGALDTYASQAVGARNYAALGSMFKQAVLWLMLHTIPIAAIFVYLPTLLLHLGQPEDVITLLRPYLLALLPGVWIDAIYRPFMRILFAQHVSSPQMWVSIFVAIQHVPVTYLCIHKLNAGYLGGAYSTVWSSALAALLVAVYIHSTGLSARVWKSPNGVVFQPWRPYAKLSYSACAMRAIEMWSLNLCTVAAGWLPDPAPAIAAMAVASSIYSGAYMCYGAMTIAACTRVGNGLGAGSAPMAKLSAKASATIVPILWAVMASILLIPASQHVVIRFFTSDTDKTLLNHMCHLLNLLAVLIFFDGTQLVMSGIASGAGKQTKGFFINIMAHWGLGLPSALLLGFHFKLGVEGLYSGVILGPAAQMCCYVYLLLKMDWGKEARIAHAAMLAIAASRAEAGIWSF